MTMSVDGAFIYFTIPIFGGIPITQTTVSHLIVTIFLCTLSILLGKRLTKRPEFRFHGRLFLSGQIRVLFHH